MFDTIGCKVTHSIAISELYVNLYLILVIRRWQMKIRRPGGSDLLPIPGFRNPGRQHSSTDPDFLDDVLTQSYALDAPFEDGVVIRTHPKAHTVDVETDNGTVVGVRILSPFLTASGGGLSVIPPIGSRCIICTSTEIPFILGFTSEPDAQTTPQDSSKPPAITRGTDGFGGQDPTYGTDNDTNFRGGRSDDSAPGDVVIESDDGNLMAVLRGVTVMKGSDTSQIIMTNLGGLVRVVSNLYQHFHAAGQTEILNKKNKTTYRLRVGTDSKTNGVVEPVVHVTLGAESDVIEVLVTEEDGEKKLRAHVASNGDLTLAAADGELEFNGDLVVEVDGDIEIEGDADFEMSLSGNLALGAEGNTSISTGGNRDESVAGNYALNAVGDTAFITQGRFTQSVQGTTEIQHAGSVRRNIILNDYGLTVGPSLLGGALCELTMGKVGDIALTSVKSAVLGGRLSTEVKGLQVDLGTGIRAPVIRTTDLNAIAEAIIGYINVSNTLVGPKIVIPQPAGAALTPLLSAVGSKIVKAA